LSMQRWKLSRDQMNFMVKLREFQTGVEPPARIQKY
jgi:hypothetical protein